MSSKLSPLILSWDTILLLALGSSHLWFNKASSAILVFLMLVYVLLDVFYPDILDKPILTLKQKVIYLTKLSIVLFSVMFAALLPTGHAILQRQINGPATHANDGLIQIEVATEFLLQGKNPYTETYDDTILADWRGGEPPFQNIPGILQHNAYLPFTFILSIPFYLMGHIILGWYDQRLLYFVSYMLALLLLPLLVKDKRQQLILTILVGLNFLFVFFLADGRNDVIILLGLILATTLLSRKRNSLSLFILGLTLMLKHQAWFFLPFFLLHTLPKSITKLSIKHWLLSLWPLYFSVFVVLTPFLIWDTQAFVEDTIYYILGVSEYSFPIRGIGFSYFLASSGLLPSYDTSFPFVLISLIFGLPVFIYLLFRQYRNRTLSNMWFGFALSALMFQFFLRFFNDHYFIFGLQCLFIANFIDVDAA